VCYGRGDSSRQVARIRTDSYGTFAEIGVILFDNHPPTDTKQFHVRAHTFPFRIVVHLPSLESIHRLLRGLAFVPVYNENTRVAYHGGSSHFFGIGIFRYQICSVSVFFGQYLLTVNTYFFHILTVTTYLNTYFSYLFERKRGSRQDFDTENYRPKFPSVSVR
jgi:hypothetical protein